MLISHPFQFVYLKTSKTAGASVEMALQATAFPAPSYGIQLATHAMIGVKGVVGRRLVHMLANPRETALDKTWRPHMPASTIRDLMGDILWRRYCKVACVRNPFDRMVSNFHWRRTVRHEMRGQQGAPEMDEIGFAAIKAEFREFILSSEAIVDEEFVFFDGRLCIDKAIRCEALNEDLIRVGTALGLDPEKLMLPQTLKSRHLRGQKHVSDYYDADTIERVKSRMAWVFDTYGYPLHPAAGLSE